MLAQVVTAHCGAPSDARIRARMGADKREALAALLGVPISDPLVDRAHRAFVDALATAYRDTPPVPFPSVPQALAALRAAGVQVAVTTGFDRQITGPLLAAVGWVVPDVLDAVVCADEVAAGRPNPFLVRRATELTGVADPARVLVAGDTVLDVQAGRAARAGTVLAVLTGARPAAELAAAGPDRVVDGVADLPGLLGIAARSA